MSESFTKLFSSILGSTIWREDSDTKVVWITMLAMADRNGHVGASIPGLAALAGVSVEATEAAIGKFLAPDRHSRSKNDDGRRIAVADRGWRIVNYGRFREERCVEERRAYDRERKRADRSGQKRTTTECLPPSAHAEAEAEAERAAAAGGSPSSSEEGGDIPTAVTGAPPRRGCWGAPGERTEDDAR